MVLVFNNPSYTVSGTFEEEDIILEIPVTNSGINRANAYVYTISGSQFLNKISNNYDGPYYGLEDSVLFSTEYSARFPFRIGLFDDTIMNENGAVTLDNTDYISENYKWDPNSKCYFLILYPSDITRISNYNNQNGAARTILFFNKGKWYWEVNFPNDRENFCGVGTIDASISPGDYLGKDIYGWSIGQNGNIYHDTTVSAIGSNLTSMRVGVALDIDNGKIWFSRNGTWEGSANPAAGTNPAFTNVSGTVYPMCSLSGIDVNNSSTAYMYLHEEDFVYDIPLGFNTTETLISGYYYTPIFNYIHQLTTSYLVLDDPIGITDSIEVRSSNIKPIELIELYWLGKTNIYKYDIYTKQEDENWPESILTSTTPRSVSVCNVNGNVIANVDNKLRCYDRTGALLYSVTNDKYQFDKKMLTTTDGNSVWGYGETYGAIIKFNLKTAELIYEETYNANRDDFVYTFDIEKEGAGIWYTNTKTNKVIHLSSTGTKIFDKAFGAPRAVATTSDNGCWVFNYGYKNFYRFNYYGNVVGSFTFTKNVDQIYTDSDDSIWFIANDSIGHINLLGQQDKIRNNFYKPDSLVISSNYIFVYSAQINIVIILNKITLETIYTYKLNELTGFPAVLNVTYDNQKVFDTNILPLPTDPVWGTNSTLLWETMNKNNIVLNNAKYHQVKITFSNNYLSTYPELRNIYEAPVISLGRIEAGNSKNIYIKTNNINEAMDHSLSLRVSWEEYSGG